MIQVTEDGSESARRTQPHAELIVKHLGLRRCGRTVRTSARKEEDNDTGHNASRGAHEKLRRLFLSL